MYFLLTIIGLVVTASAKDVIVGDGGSLVYEQNVTASPAIWRRNDNVTININATMPNEIISRIVIIDNREDKEGEAAIVDGGIGFENVTIELKSPTVFRGYDFEIQIYVKEEEQVPEVPQVPGEEMDDDSLVTVMPNANHTTIVTGGQDNVPRPVNAGKDPQGSMVKELDPKDVKHSDEELVTPGIVLNATTQVVEDQDKKEQNPIKNHKDSDNPLFTTPKVPTVTELPSKNDDKDIVTPVPTSSTTQKIAEQEKVQQTTETVKDVKSQVPIVTLLGSKTESHNDGKDPTTISTTYPTPQLDEDQKPVKAENKDINLQSVSESEENTDAKPLSPTPIEDNHVLSTSEFNPMSGDEEWQSIIDKIFSNDNLPVPTVDSAKHEPTFTQSPGVNTNVDSQDVKTTVTMENKDSAQSNVPVTQEPVPFTNSNTEITINSDVDITTPNDVPTVKPIAKGA